MRWPWRPDPDAVEELRKAERELEKVREQWADVHEVAAESRFHKRRNHFAEAIAYIYRETS